jgi:hypothetical protein
MCIMEQKVLFIFLYFLVENNSDLLNVLGIAAKGPFEL